MYDFQKLQNYATSRISEPQDIKEQPIGATFSSLYVLPSSINIWMRKVEIVQFLLYPFFSTCLIPAMHWSGIQELSVDKRWRARLVVIIFLLMGGLFWWPFVYFICIYFNFGPLDKNESGCDKFLEFQSEQTNSLYLCFSQACSNELFVVILIFMV